VWINILARAYSFILRTYYVPCYLWNINALKIRRLSIFSIPFDFLKIYVYLDRIEYPCAVMQIVPLRKCTNFHGTSSSMIVGDYSPDGAAFPFSIHLQTNCRLCLLDDIIAGRLNGLTFMQNEKLRGRTCGLLLSYVMLLSLCKVAARSLSVGYGTYYAIWHECLIAMMGHPTLTIRNSQELRWRWAERIAATLE